MKKLLIFLTAIAMLGLTACQSDKQENPNNTAVSEPVEEIPAEPVFTEYNQSDFVQINVAINKQSGEPVVPVNTYDLDKKELYISDINDVSSIYLVGGNVLLHYDSFEYSANTLLIPELGASFHLNRNENGVSYNRPPRKLKHPVCQIFCHMAALSSSEGDSPLSSSALPYNKIFSHTAHFSFRGGLMDMTAENCGSRMRHRVGEVTRTVTETEYITKDRAKLSAIL